MPAQTYPLISEYVEAILSAEDNFNELAHLRSVLNADGTPYMSAGNYAVVFKMQDPNTGKLYAVKCFLKDQLRRAESYKLISEELDFVQSSYLLNVRYLENELFVDTEHSESEEFPVLLMDWVEGKTLDGYLNEHIHDKYACEMLAYQFCSMASWLLSQPFAHGDIKPDNIIVRKNGSMVLVDYDGMFVPAMKGQTARELGSPDFRHPSRNESDFDEHIDDFALASIALSLKAIAIDPKLLADYGAKDRLLFSEQDYRNLSESSVWKAISDMLNDESLTKLAGLFLVANATHSLSSVSFRLFRLPKTEKTGLIEVRPKEPLERPKVIAKEDLYHLLLTQTNEREYESLLHRTRGTSPLRFSDEYGVTYSKIVGDGGLRLVNFNTSDKIINTYSIQDGTKIICDYSFRKSRLLKELIIPDSVTHIGERAFEGCVDLRIINIPPTNNIYIGTKAFYGCHEIALNSLNDTVYGEYYQVVARKRISDTFVAQKWFNMCREAVVCERMAEVEGHEEEKCVKRKCICFYCGNSTHLEILSNMSALHVGDRVDLQTVEYQILLRKDEDGEPFDIIRVDGKKAKSSQSDKQIYK